MSCTPYRSGSGQRTFSAGLEGRSVDTASAPLQDLSRTSQEGNPKCPTPPTFGRYAEIPYDEMTPEQQEGYGSFLKRSYEERQRKPDDLEAQEGQRPIAIHALENLAHSDTGIVMPTRFCRRRKLPRCPTAKSSDEGRG